MNTRITLIIAILLLGVAISFSTHPTKPIEYLFTAPYTIDIINNKTE